MRERHKVGRGHTTGYRRSQPGDASRDAVRQMEVEATWAVMSGGMVRGRELRVAEGLGWDVTAKWPGLFRLWKKVLVAIGTSHAINDHTFLEELELDCSREGAVGSVTWDIRSEGCTRLKSNREILIRDIRRQI